MVLSRWGTVSVANCQPASPAMIEDMTARRLGAGTQRLHISSCRRFAAKSVQAKPASPHRGTEHLVRYAAGSPIGLTRMISKRRRCCRGR